MRASILIFSFLLMLTSCVVDDENYAEINGRIERNATGEGIADQKLVVTTKVIHGSGLFSYTEDIDTREVTTDVNGNFSVTLNAPNNAFVSIYRLEAEDDPYTDFGIENFEINEDILIKVDKYVYFKITIKNTAPFDENDYVFVNFFTLPGQSFRTNIENFGVENTMHPAEDLPGGGGVGPYEEASWNGTNVNSIVYYKIPENSEAHKLYWVKRKNGNETIGFTDNIPFIVDEINTYNFEY